MVAQRIIRTQDVLQLVAIFLLLVLAAAAANVPLATTFLIHRTRPMGITVNFQGPEAAAHGWPAPTPHPRPWPSPQQWSAGCRFGTASYRVSAPGATPGQNGFQMEVERYGWPLPTLERVECWWNWNDLALKGPEPDPPLHLYWPGLVLNPLMIGSGLYVLLVVPIAAFTLGRRAARRHARPCPYCAYPLGAHDFCPECGRPVPRLTTATPTAA